MALLEFNADKKSLQFFMPKSFCFKDYLKKPIPGDVLAQVLQEPIGGSHSDQDGPGCQ